MSLGSFSPHYSTCSRLHAIEHQTVTFFMSDCINTQCSHVQVGTAPIRECPQILAAISSQAGRGTRGIRIGARSFVKSRERKDLLYQKSCSVRT